VTDPDPHILRHIYDTGIHHPVLVL